MYEPELGQALFSNGQIEYHDSPDFVEAGLEVIAQGVAVYRADDIKQTGLLISNSGAQEFINDVFEMRSYCWCDGGLPDHEDGGCPPNFVFTPTDLQINWYKHCGRGRSQNRKITLAEWLGVVGACMRSLHG